MNGLAPQGTALRSCARLDLDALRRKHPLPGVIGAAVKLVRRGGEWVGCCPFHADRSPSFTIFDGGTRFHCFGCGAGGDVFDYLARAHGAGLREAAAMLDGGELPRAASVAIASPREQTRDKVEQARAVWRGAVAASGTPVEAYLRRRGLHLPIPEDVRFAILEYGSGADRHPCMVAAVRSAEGEVTGVQRTYLAPGGAGKAAVPKPKLSLGQVSGGAIRCAPAGAEGLLVCEGLEDALTLQQELGRAAWAAAGASMLPAMRLPASVRSVVIGADGDAAGEAAAARAEGAFTARALAVRIIRPLPGCKDFNDELTGGGA